MKPGKSRVFAPELQKKYHDMYVPRVSQSEDIQYCLVLSLASQANH